MMEKWAIITRDKEKMQEFFDVIRKEHEQEFVKVGSFSDDNFRLEIYKSFVLYWIPNLFTFINLKYDKVWIDSRIQDKNSTLSFLYGRMVPDGEIIWI